MIKTSQKLSLNTIVFNGLYYYKITSKQDSKGYFKIKCLEKPDSMEFSVHENWIKECELIQNGI